VTGKTDLMEHVSQRTRQRKSIYLEPGPLTGRLFQWWSLGSLDCGEVNGDAGKRARGSDSGGTPAGSRTTPSDELPEARGRAAGRNLDSWDELGGPPFSYWNR